MQISKKLLCFYTSNYEDIVKKGVEESYFLFKEDNLFDEVMLVCPFARKNKKVNIGKGINIIQYGWKSRIDLLNSFKLTKILGSIIIILKLLFVFPFKILIFKPDIIRATDPYYLGLISLFYAKLFKIPFVVSVHSDYQKCFISSGLTFTIFGFRYLPLLIERFVYKQADMILPISEYLKNVIINTHNINKDKINVIYHGLDFKKFDETNKIDIYKKFNIDKSLKIISYVARLSKEKNSLDILQIALHLKKNRQDFIILIAGDGLEKNYMINYAKENNLDTYIKFLGFQTRDVVISLREQCNLSLCLYDGHSLIEACAAKRPVIAYNVEWHSELIKNKETGFLVSEHDYIDTVDKIVTILNNEELALNMGKCARKTSFDMLNIKKTISKKQIYYNKLLQG